MDIIITPDYPSQPVNFGLLVHFDGDIIAVISPDNYRDLDRWDPSQKLKDIIKVEMYPTNTVTIEIDFKGVESFTPMIAEDLDFIAKIRLAGMASWENIDCYLEPVPHY